MLIEVFGEIINPNNIKYLIADLYTLNGNKETEEGCRIVFGKGLVLVYKDKTRQEVMNEINKAVKNV